MEGESSTLFRKFNNYVLRNFWESGNELMHILS